MTQRIYIDRSRYESGQRCLRARYLNYHFAGTGIESARKPLPLAVGGSVHVGLATLLRHAMQGSLGLDWAAIEESGVQTVLADFSQHQRRLELPDAEAAMLLAATDKPTLVNPTLGSDYARDEMEEYLFTEQSALVEALVRAYSRRRLRPLLEQFEVLEVEREGEWLLWEDRPSPDFGDGAVEGWFMSRPDALLRERESNQLYLLSYKTTGSWDIRKARDAEHDMQGMSEGIEIERRLGIWWSALHSTPPDMPARAVLNHANPSLAVLKYLNALDAPPRILAVRYEYLLKGERWKDKELSERFGVETRSQKSHLIRRYEAVSVPMRGAAGYNIGDSCWSWDYIRDDGRESSLAWQNWKSRGVFEAVTGGAHIDGGVKDWIDKLDDAAPTMSAEDSTMGIEPQLLGYKCDAQSVGVTKDHPLDAVFIPPIIVYRNDDELRDMVEQLESVERRIAEGVAAVREAESQRDEGEIRHAMNVHFPQTRRACEYPTTCAFSRICYGGAEIRSDPVAGGLYTIRKANHPQEDAAKG